MSINEESDKDIDIDPLAPEMGTRAYREREKREMLRRKMDESKEGKESDNEMVKKVIADNVVFEMGMETLSWVNKGTKKDDAKLGNGKEVDGVRVVKSFEVIEESAAGPS